MENLFILFELPFDPPENDIQKIEAALTKKKNQWAKDSINPAKKAKVLGYLEHFQEFREIMLNQDSREQEAVEAKQIKSSKRLELEKKLKLYMSKGDELSEKDLKTFIKHYSPYGYSQEEIKEIFSSMVKIDSSSIDISQILKNTHASSIKNFMEQLSMKDKTLYDVLELPSTASGSQLCDAAENIKKRILSKGEATGKDTALKSLCGLCIIIFKDPEGKKKYDNYLKLTQYNSVNDAIDDLASSNQKRIEPKMKESLIDIAVSQYHISVSDASIYINNYCAYMGFALPDNKIICGLCQSENPAGSTHCVKCGKPLVIVCPSCGAENGNAAKSCAKCGFDLTKMNKAIELLDEAKKKYASKELDEAEYILKEAEAYWPNHGDILALKKNITDDRKKAAENIAAIMKDIQDKKLYGAQTKIDQIRASGFQVDEAVASRVRDSLKNVEKQLTKIRSLSGNEAFHLIMSLSEIVTDSYDLNIALQKYPPESCTSLTGRISEGIVALQWKPSLSQGEITYQLVRQENAYPNTPSDGTIIYNGKEHFYTDRSLISNVVYYYAVFAIRLGIYSQATRLEESVAIVEPIKNFKAVGGDQIVTLSWEKSSKVTEIRLWKYCGMERPQEESSYESVPCTRLDGLVVQGLENATCYWFAVSAGYNLKGKTYFSDKITISAVPQRPAEPLQDFQVLLIDNVFQASWRKSEWDVIFFYAKRQPSYVIGTIYDLDELLSKYQKIDVNLKSHTTAEFRLDFVGECYIIPGVINVSNVILNTAAYISSMPCVKNITFDINTSRTELYVNFTWPKKIEHSLMVYRMDDYPSGVDDPLAHRVECSKRQYDSNAGILISNPAKGTFYTKIYTYYELDDKRIYSEGVRTLLSNEPQKDVVYTFKYKKPNLFNKYKLCKLILIVEVNGNCVFPAFTVISKFKSTPLKRDDGDVVCTMDEYTEIKGRHTFEFEVEPIKTETYLKLFFLNDKNYKSFKIACKSGNLV